MNYLQLIQAFEGQGHVSPQDLAKKFDVSERSIRNYVRDINASLDGVAEIAMRRGKGYVLVVHDSEAYAKKLAQLQRAQEDALPSTASGRVRYLVNDLIMRTDWVTLDELAQELLASRRTISQNLKDVESFIAPFDLTLQRRTHRGVRIEGSERDRRLCLAAAVLDDEMQADGANLSSIHAMLPAIKKTVSAILAEEDFHVSSYAYQNLIVHIAVAIMRCRKGAHMLVDEESREQAKQRPEYRIAVRLADALEEQFNISLPAEEAAYMAIHLEGRKSLSTYPDEGAVVISDEVWNLVNEMLDVVKESLGYDFGNDIELRMNLARHVAPLLVRMQHNMKVQNPLLSDIRIGFPLGYAMAMDASAVLTQATGAKLSDEEIGYIALDFALALKRRSTSYPKKNILIVCASGAGSARLLEQQYRQEFGSYLGKITTCDINGLDTIDFDKIDYVFATVPLDCELPVPVRQVSYFLDTQQIEDVRSDLAADAEEFDIVDYFDARLFFPHLSFKTKIETIDFLCDRTAEVIDMPQSFKRLVHVREKLARTTFGNNVAMPHPQVAVSPRTIVTVGILDEPILWDGTPVQAIFLICVSKGRNYDLQPFYRAMARLMTSEPAIAELTARQDFGTLLHLLVGVRPKE